MSSPPPATHRVTTGDDGHPLLVKRAEHPDTRARLRGEAAVLRSLDHPGVVRLRDHVEAPDATELHLEWVGPHSLATVAGVPAGEAAVLVARAAEVVADLHRTGISHGRLTADHVLLATEGRPVLTGLAGARAVDDQRATDDVAALGALLCELVQPLDEGPAIPPTRRARPRPTGLRAALLTLADQAQADDPTVRPDAAGLAQRLRATVPSGARRPRRRRSGVVATSVPPTAAPTAPAATPATAGSGGRTAPTTPLLRRPAPPRARPSPRHVRMAVGLAVALVGTVAAAAWIRPDRASPAPGAAAPSTTAPATTVDPSPTSTTAGPTATGPATAAPPTTTPTVPPVGAGPAPCPDVAGPVLADVDADGCPDAVTILGERVTVGGTTWVAGRPGDVVAVADWDCDGWATPASVRPATGEVFVFDRWAAPGEEVTVAVVATVDGAATVRPIDGDGDGCSDLVVERHDAPPVGVEVTR